MAKIIIPTTVSNPYILLFNSSGQVKAGQGGTFGTFNPSAYSTFPIEKGDADFDENTASSKIYELSISEVSGDYWWLLCDNGTPAYGDATVDGEAHHFGYDADADIITVPNSAQVQLAVKPFLQQRVAAPHVVEASTRADGRMTNQRVLIRKGETVVVAWDYGKRLASGDVLDAMTLPVSSNTGTVTVTNETGGEKQWGVAGQQAKATIVANGSAVTGTEVEITTDITPDGSSVEKAMLVVEIFDASI